MRIYAFGRLATLALVAFVAALQGCGAGTPRSGSEGRALAIDTGKYYLDFTSVGYDKYTLRVCKREAAKSSRCIYPLVNKVSKEVVRFGKIPLAADFKYTKCQRAAHWVYDSVPHALALTTSGALSTCATAAGQPILIASVLSAAVAGWIFGLDIKLGNAWQAGRPEIFRGLNLLMGYGSELGADRIARTQFSEADVKALVSALAKHFGCDYKFF